MSEICVVARATAKPGKEKELQAAMLAVVAPTRKETGCKWYELQVNETNAAFYQMNEIWASREVWEKHLEMPYIKDLFKKVPDLVVSPPEMMVFRPVKS